MTRRRRRVGGGVCWGRGLAAPTLLVAVGLSGSILACDDAHRASARDAGTRDGSPSTGDLDAASDAPTFTRPVVFGASCGSDQDCGTTLHCLLPAGGELAPDRHEGPAGGLCSRPCAAPFDCFDGVNDATCGSLSTSGPTFCLPTCTHGTGASGESKCLGRNELACESSRTSPTGGLCVPVCGSTTDCGALACDLATGLCRPRDDAGLGAAGAPLGASCDTQACASGYCLRLGLTTSVCSGFCTVGTVGCGFDPASRHPLDAYCTLQDAPGASDHDLGLCAQLCDCDDDCRSSRLVCAAAPAGAGILMSVRGRRGACLPEDGVNVRTPCAHDAGARDAAVP